ncbi:MAG TPA: pirin family protein, partial [Chitinophagales bacterium]|nr:pirin family protein [Chitinophagales bacterium]
KMNTIIHKANERGNVNHGWLKANHSFSFANFYDPKKEQFGTLRVLNDDVVEAGFGFGMHPHNNMEIVTIPLKGALKHKDSSGGEGVIKTGDVQIMSAGKGIMHSEMATADEDVNLFQIWVFPKKVNIEPRYDQRFFDEKDRENNWQIVVSPDEAHNALWINQDAYFSLGNFTATTSYKLNNENNGVYLMIIEGEIEIEGNVLSNRDAIGITDAKDFQINVIQPAKLLAIEVPMK